MAIVWIGVPVDDAVVEHPDMIRKVRAAQKPGYHQRGTFNLVDALTTEKGGPAQEGYIVRIEKTKTT